jgi:hypothetical protein
MAYKYVETIQTDKGPKKISKNTPITDYDRQAIMTDFKVEKKPKYQRRSIWDTERGYAGTPEPSAVATTKEDIKDVGTQVKELFTENKQRHDYRKKRNAQPNNQIDPFNMFHTDMDPGTPDNPTQRNILKLFGRGASAGLTRFTEGDSGAEADAYQADHSLTSSIADLLGGLALSKGVRGGRSFLKNSAKAAEKETIRQIANANARKGVYTKVVLPKKAVIPETNLSSLVKTAGGSGAYSAERQLVDSLGTDDPEWLKNTLYAGGVGTGVGAGVHGLTRFLGAAANRINPIEAKKTGVWGAKVKNTNAQLSGQLPADIMQDALQNNAILADVRNPNITKLVDEIGRDPAARAQYLKLPKKPAGNGGKYSREMTNTFKTVKGTKSRAPVKRGMNISLTPMGQTKNVFKQMKNQFSNITKGSYTPTDLVKLFGKDSGELATVLNKKMNLSQQDQVAAALAKLLDNYKVRDYGD